MADPNPSIWNATDTAEVTAINYGTGDAGTYLLLEAGTEYHVWNDKGKIQTSSPMTSVKVSARDDNGDEVKNITTQHWVEIKSLTIHAGGAGGSIVGYTDDAMTEFQPVGLNAPLAIGDIPYDCYRKIMVRVHMPNSAIEGAVTFQIIATNQEPSTSIAKWITGLHGNGVVYLTTGAFGVSINGGDASLLDIEKGFALIDNLETYYGAAQQYSVAALENGTYKLYLTSVGVISAIISTSSIPANSIELSRVVVSGGVATGVTDKRLFLANIMVGLDAAKTATPTINQVYIATDTLKMYICFVDDSWTQVIPYLNMVTKTGDFTAGKIVKINNASGIIEMATNTDAEVTDAVTKKHTQNTDTDLDATFEATLAKSGANTDITSLAGLTTPLGVAYGGTGLITGALCLLSSTTVDFNADADTVIYTVPVGKRCILSHAIVVAAGDAGATTTISIGANGAETDFIPANTLSNLGAQYDSVILQPIPNTTPLKLVSYAAEVVIEARVANQSGVAGNTVYLFGILY